MSSKPSSIQPTEQLLLKKAYQAFNARDIEAVLRMMHPEVKWANGWEGGYVYGHTGVRQYWTRQWAVINPHVEPVGFRVGESGSTIVNVHAVVRDLAGKVIANQMVEHTYIFENGLIRSMEISKG